MQSWGNDKPQFVNQAHLEERLRQDDAPVYLEGSRQRRTLLNGRLGIMSMRPGQFKLMPGDTVLCSDGDCGTLDRLLIDLHAKVVKYLAVEQSDGAGHGRLVPFDLLLATEERLVLGCTRSEYEALDAADRPEVESMSYSVERGSAIQRHVDKQFMLPQIPDGTVELRADIDVRATDGHIGSLKGLVVDSGDGRILQLIVATGHLRGKKDVSISGETMGEFDIDGALHLTSARADVLSGMSE